MINSLSTFHSLSDKSVCLVEHHSLRESELRLALGLQIHTQIVQLVKLISVLLQSVLLRGSLLKDVLLRVEENIEVGKVEALINHLLNLFLSFGREFPSINPFAFLRVIVYLRAALVSLPLALPLRSDVVLQERIEYLLYYSRHKGLILAITYGRKEWAQQVSDSLV